MTIGANDGLRGLPLKESRKNLLAIVEGIESFGAKVILGGMKLPANYGKEYTGSFENMYRTISTEKNVLLIPFLLEGVGGFPELNISDGLHPNPAGHKIIADLVYRFLQEKRLE